MAAMRLDVRKLRSVLGTDEVVVDSTLCEVLQGLGSERSARQVEALLRRFQIVPMAGDAVAVLAVRNFRSLRRLGITISKTIDLIHLEVAHRRIVLRSFTTTATSIQWRAISG